MIVLDTDVTFATDIAELWKIFRVLKGRQVRTDRVIIVVCLHIDVYCVSKMCGFSFLNINISFLNVFVLVY